MNQIVKQYAIMEIKLAACVVVLEFECSMCMYVTRMWKVNSHTFQVLEFYMAYSCSKNLQHNLQAHCVNNYE